MTEIRRVFSNRTTAEAAVQDLCDAGVVLDDIDVQSGLGAVRVTVRVAAARTGRVAEVLDRHTAAGGPAPAAPGAGEPEGPTTEDVRREREAVWSGGASGGAASAAHFGAEMATNPRYGDADWAIVEPEARRQWLERGAGNWAAVRDAVRSAWQRARDSRRA